MENNNIPTKVIALGGIREVGKNCYVFEHDDEIFIVDCGIKFADKDISMGVSGIIVPFDYLKANQNKIKGLIITHAHEDHIGGIPYLLQAIPGIKIYGARYTCAILKTKLEEYRNKLQPYSFEEFNDDWKLHTKHFKIEVFRVCHSVPDAFGVYFETVNGKIITTGDFRFDFDITNQTDLSKISELGLRDIDLLLCESTNSEKGGFSMSEKVILNDLERIFKRAKGRIFCSMFASNLDRANDTLKIALKLKRKVLVLGRSMVNAIKVAKDIKYFTAGATDFIERPDFINNYKDEEIFVLMTGSQGEELAALNQLANGVNKNIVVKPTDTIVLSSRPIPGNYKPVEVMVNKLYNTGANIILDSPLYHTHASGHATAQEQQLMIKLINPRYLLPIHGELKMQNAIKRTAISSGVERENVIIAINGQVTTLTNHKAEATEKFVNVENVYIDGRDIAQDASNLLKKREILSTDGVILCSFVIDKKTKKLASNPQISSKGSFISKNSMPAVTKLSYLIKEQVENLPDQNETNIKNTLTPIIDNFIWINFKKKPVIVINSYLKE